MYDAHDTRGDQAARIASLVGAEARTLPHPIRAACSLCAFDIGDGRIAFQDC
jgi:hypothetical protein